jgi:hypothetical protein
MRDRERRSIKKFGLDTDRDEYLPEDQELEQQLVYEDQSLSDLHPLLINPETKFAKFKDIFVQTMTWTNLIITPVGIVFYEEIGDSTDILEWVVDIAWTVEILLAFITPNFNNRTFKEISRNYLKFWFWIDALATFPAMYYLQNSRLVNLLKFLRLLHFFELFSPFLLIIEYIMKDAIRKKIENTYSLVKLFAGAILLGHFAACFWVFLGKLDEKGWVSVLEDPVNGDSEGQWQTYGAFEEYVFALYWTFTVLTTVGYGDFTGGESLEYCYTMGLQFLGLTFFASLTGLLSSLLTTGGGYDEMVSEKQEETAIWVMKL